MTAVDTRIAARAADAMPTIQLLFFNDPDTYPPIVNSTRLLAEAGWRVQLICRRDLAASGGVKYPENAELRRIDIPRILGPAGFAYFIGKALAISQPRPSIVVGHDMHGLIAARVLAARHGCPYVYHCHDFADDGFKLPLTASLVRRAERCIARGAAEVIVPDRDRAQVVAHQLNLAKEPLIIANAPMSSARPSNVVLRSRLREAGYHFSKIVLRQGRIARGHAIESTLRSLGRWKNPDWGFVIMGPGEASYIEGLKHLARQLGVSKQFAVLPAVPYDDLARYTFDADLGHGLYEPTHVNNIYITTASNKLMEYMQAGLPLLVSDRPSLASFIAQRKCGVCADESDPEAIAAAVNGVLDNPADAAVMGGHSTAAFSGELCYERQFAPALVALDRLTGRRIAATS